MLHHWLGQVCEDINRSAHEKLVNEPKHRRTRFINFASREIFVRSDTFELIRHVENIARPKDLKIRIPP